MHSTLQTGVATNERQDAVLEALKVNVQLKADHLTEAHRILAEQLVRQRGDLRAIRELIRTITDDAFLAGTAAVRARLSGALVSGTAPRLAPSRASARAAISQGSG